MANIATARDPEAHRVMAEAYAVNDRMNQLVLEHLDARVGSQTDRGRWTYDRSDLRGGGVQSSGDADCWR